MIKYILIVVNIVLTGGYMIVLKNYANDDKNNPYCMGIYNGFAYGIAGVLLGATYLIGNPWHFECSMLYAMAGGFFAGLGGIPYIKALPLAPGSMIQPLLGMTYPLIALGGLFIFREQITAKVIIGIACGVVAIYLFNSEDKKNAK